MTHKMKMAKMFKNGSQSPPLFFVADGILSGSSVTRPSEPMISVCALFHPHLIASIAVWQSPEKQEAARTR